MTRHQTHHPDHATQVANADTAVAAAAAAVHAMVTA